MAELEGFAETLLATCPEMFIESDTPTSQQAGKTVEGDC
jgi:hypothetical protein